MVKLNGRTMELNDLPRAVIDYEPSCHETKRDSHARESRETVEDRIVAFVKSETRQGRTNVRPKDIRDKLEECDAKLSPQKLKLSLKELKDKEIGGITIEGDARPAGGDCPAAAAAADGKAEEQQD